MGGWGDAGKGAASGAISGAAGGPIGMAIGAGLGALGGGLSKPSPGEIAQNALYKSIPGWLDQASAATGNGLADLNRAGKFYGTILGGNREDINNLLSPQVSTVLSQYDNAANTIRQFSPRGGGSTATLAQLPFAKASTYGQAYQSQLGAAAPGLAKVGEATGELGQGLRSSATGLAPVALGNQQHIDTLQANAGKGIGQAGGSGNLSSIISSGKGLGGLLAKILTKVGIGSGGSGGDFGSPGGSFDAGSFGDPEA